MKRKFSYKIKFGDLFLMALGFGLAFFDMQVLQNGLHLMTGANTGISSLLALGIATTANTFALDWGRTNGKTKAKRAINKASLVGFLAWVAFGIGYVAIEIITVINAMEKDGGINWANQIGQFLLLGLSYVISGIAIQRAARDIWDLDASACRDSEAEFNIAAKKVSRNDAKISYMLTELENYDQKYKTLDEQYKKKEDAIRHAEDSVINEILGKTLQNNPDISPSEARKVVEQAKKDAAL